MDGIPLAPARQSKTSAGALAVWLAGLQAGMLGVLWMLAWMGVSSAWQDRGFWMPENLFATAFYGGPAIQPGLARTTFSGLALYLLLYSLLGAGFAAVVRGRLTRGRTLLAAVLFGAAWYFLSFHWIWKTAMPLAYLLHPENATFLGHLIYGTFLGRFPIYLEPPAAATPAAPSGHAPEEGVEAAPDPPGAESSAAPAMPAPTQSSSPLDPV